MIRGGFEINECCPKFVAMLEAGDLLTFIVDIKGPTISSDIYICADRGDGDTEKIFFCPWCGIPIEIVSGE